MNNEEKDLLLKDLSARLPYGVKCKTNIAGSISPRIVTKITLDGYIGFGSYDFRIEIVKPYLFPLSSMTEEQREELANIALKEAFFGIEVIDWLNAHHFDYKGLIESNLGIDATGLNIY